MPSPAGNDYMTTLRINEVRRDIQDNRTIPGDLMFLNALNQNESPNEWLTAKWKGNLQIADLVAPNAPGVAYAASRTYVEASNLQNMRVGTTWTADQVEEWYRIKASGAIDRDGIFANGLFHQAVLNQIKGTEWRMEWLAVAMATDGFYGTSSYNRLGFSLTAPDGRTPSWGMKPDMKSFVQTPLGNPDGTVNKACPIIDYIYQMCEIRRQRYGKRTNRLRMRTATKRAIQQTTQFMAYAVYEMPSFRSFNNISPANYARLDQLLDEVLAGANRDGDMQVVTYDSVYQTESGDGTPAVYVPFLPLAPEACILMDDSANDKNNAVHDFGIGTTMESRANSLRYSRDAIPDDLPAGTPGMFSYMEMNQSMNPVAFSTWTVARAWPRKFDEVCESVLFLGPLGDPVPVTDIAII